MSIPLLFRLLFLFFLCSCSTLSIPVLRHETGETLGENGKNIAFRAETSRAIPTPPTQSGSTFSATQDSNRLQSSLFGLNLKYGLLSNLDLKFDTPLLMGGGGWRFNAKYQLLGAPSSSSSAGNIAGSAMISYGKYSSRGEVTYNSGSSTGTTTSTSAGSELTFFQNLSATTIEFSFPISIKVADGFIIYSGVYYFMLKAAGNIDTEVTEVSTSDLGFNLGIQNKIDTLLLNIEGMMLKAENPFSGESNFEVYFGVSAGLSF